MASRDKKYKYVEDMIEDYLRLTDEQKEIPLAIEKIRKKQDALMTDLNGGIVKMNDAEDVYKLHMQLKKWDERKSEIEEEMEEVEESLKDFLTSINGKQLSYEKKDDVEKMKITYLFWLEDGNIKCNR